MKNSIDDGRLGNCVHCADRHVRTENTQDQGHLAPADWRFPRRLENSSVCLLFWERRGWEARETGGVGRGEVVKSGYYKQFLVFFL